jgi:aspartate--ammonia ligase
MNAIRRDDSCDNVHSIYVDQWDWEMVICREQRNEDFLKRMVTRIVSTICDTLEETKKVFPAVDTILKREVTFVTTEELKKRYPDMTAHERERAVAKEHGTVFLMKIGAPLSDGKPHDGRAPDYDDWALNGDILFYDKVLDESIEISSMGIRVDGNTLVSQLEMAKATDRLEHDYHQRVVSGDLPLTIGGGIGQSRLCMLLLGKAHIGEVQASLWPDEMIKGCEERGVHLL